MNENVTSNENVTPNENMCTIEQIERVISDKVRPNIALHGGDIQIVELKEDVLYVRLLGQCSGCPSADLTMENLVDTELRQAFPRLKKVALVSGVSESLLDEARALLKKRHELNQ